MLEHVEALSFLVVAICSAYASWEDVRHLEYPAEVDKILLATGLASTLSFLAVRGFSAGALLDTGLGAIVGPGALFVLSKLGAVGEGDVRYSLALSLCFPTYPWGTIQLLKNLTGLVPVASSRTPFPAVALTNALWLSGFVLMAQRLTTAKRSSPLCLAYMLAVVLLAAVFSHRLLLLLPIPLAVRSTPRSRQIPLIPILFGGLLVALTLGDLNLRILR